MKPIPISLRPLVATSVVLLLSACASSPLAPADADGWQAVPLPGKTQTIYRWGDKHGRPALAAQAEGSASMWRKRVNVEPAALGEIGFSWWVQDLIDGASVGNSEAEDAPARIVLAFEGDRTKLSARNRSLFELAQALTGEVPPYATLMYVYDAHLPVGTVVVNHRTDRIRKIVVDSGAATLRQWREHRRNVVADYERAFGEPAGPLVAIGMMTDADNSRSRAKAWYGAIALLPSAP